MSDSINEVLRGIVERHGRALFDDPRRCESCLRDTSLTPKEIAGIMAALRAGIPKRLSAMPAIGDKGIANFAGELSDSSGLSEQVALRSVGAWAFALQPHETGNDSKLEKEVKEGTIDPPVAKPSLSEAILAAIVIPVICYGAYVLGTFKVFGFEVPAWICALIVVVKCGQSIASYLTFRFGTKA